jgi:hypothetical protein
LLVLKSSNGISPGGDDGDRHSISNGNQGHGSTNFLQSVTGLTIGDKNRNSIVGTITGGRFKKRSGILSLFSQNKVIIPEKFSILHFKVEISA